MAAERIEPGLMASTLGRSRRAVTERLAVYMPDAAPRRRWEALCEAVEAGGFDVDAVVEVHYRRRGIARWTRAREQVMAQAVVATPAPSLAAVADRVGLSETHVADWLISRGHAASVVEVAARWAPTPGGPVDQRARLAAGREVETVWVVTVIAVETGAAFVATAATKDDAGRVFMGVVARNGGDGLVAVRWVIAARTLRGGSDIAAAGEGWADPADLRFP